MARMSRNPWIVTHTAMTANTAIPRMKVAFQTTARTDEEARELLSRMGMPFRRD